MRGTRVTGGVGESPSKTVSGLGAEDSITGGAGAATVSAERHSHTAG